MSQLDPANVASCRWLGMSSVLGLAALLGLACGGFSLSVTEQVYESNAEALDALILEAPGAGDHKIAKANFEAEYDALPSGQDQERRLALRDLNRRVELYVLEERFVRLSSSLDAEEARAFGDRYRALPDDTEDTRRERADALLVILDELEVVGAQALSDASELAAAEKVAAKKAAAEKAAAERAAEVAAAEAEQTRRSLEGSGYARLRTRATATVLPNVTDAWVWESPKSHCSKDPRDRVGQPPGSDEFERHESEQSREELKQKQRAVYRSLQMDVEVGEYLFDRGVLPIAIGCGSFDVT